MGFDHLELSIAFVSDSAIQKINKEYLNKDKPTNVISFSMQEGQNPSDEILGDIVISVDTADKEAKEAGISFYNRLVFLMLHGILHLCGYDHERSGEEEAKRMYEKEQEVFDKISKEFLMER